MLQSHWVCPQRTACRPPASTAEAAPPSGLSCALFVSVFNCCHEFRTHTLLLTNLVYCRFGVPIFGPNLDTRSVSPLRYSNWVGLEYKTDTASKLFLQSTPPNLDLHRTQMTQRCRLPQKKRDRTMGMPVAGLRPTAHRRQRQV